MDLTGKVAIVTGSGRGLGLAYAERLATNGAAVVVNDVAEEVAEAAADHVRVAGGKATAVTAAVGSSETADMLVAEALSEFGRLDILVTNAGILRDKVLWKMTDDDFDAGHRASICAALSPAPAPRRSDAGAGRGRPAHPGRLPGRPARQLRPDQLRRGQGRHRRLRRTWAMELARDNITVNAIVPVAATAMTSTVPFLSPTSRPSSAASRCPPTPGASSASARPRTWPAWSPSSPPTRPRRSPARRSASAATGSRCGPTPSRSCAPTATAAGARTTLPTTWADRFGSLAARRRAAARPPRPRLTGSSIVTPTSDHRTRTSMS